MKCTYCGEEFDSEDPYLQHLRDEHENELGAIDRRRINRETGDSDSSPIGIIAIGIVLLVAASVVGYMVFFSDTESTTDGQSLPDRGNETLLSDVEQFPSEGREHVPAGTSISYGTMPPTSGPHYDQTVSAGFYTEQQQTGALVHSLEHGAVVIYYDADHLTPTARESLEQFANTHTGPWQSVIVVPTPVDTPTAPYVLTAWRHKLVLNEYDSDTVRAFLAEYLGRGPEHPVR